MWELDYKESWAQKNWCFWTVVLQKALESPLGCKEIQAVHPKGHPSWIFIERTEAEAETPVLWPPDGRADSLENTLMLGKIEGRRRRGQQRVRWLDGITDSMAIIWVWVSSGNWWKTGKLGVLRSMGSQTVGHSWTELLFWSWLNPAVYFHCPLDIARENHNQADWFRFKFITVNFKWTSSPPELS